MQTPSAYEGRLDAFEYREGVQQCSKHAELDSTPAAPPLRRLALETQHNIGLRTLSLPHGDLSSFNIIADDDKVTGIIDWETAGWMPEYWEYTSAWHVNPMNPFWRDEVAKFLTPVEYELDMEKIRRRWFGSPGASA